MFFKLGEVIRQERGPHYQSLHYKSRGYVPEKRDSPCLRNVLVAASELLDQVCSFFCQYREIYWEERLYHSGFSRLVWIISILRQYLSIHRLL